MPIRQDKRVPSRGSVIIHDEFVVWQINCSESANRSPASRRERVWSRGVGQVKFRAHDGAKVTLNLIPIRRLCPLALRLLK